MRQRTLSAVLIVFGAMLCCHDWTSRSDAQTLSLEFPHTIKILGVFYTPDILYRGAAPERFETTATVVFSVSAGLAGRTIGIKLNEHGGFHCDPACEDSAAPAHITYSPASSTQLVQISTVDEVQRAEFRIGADPNGPSGWIRHHGTVSSVSGLIDNLTILPEDKKTVAEWPLTIK